MLTDRLEVRLATEPDRAHLVALFCDEAFMEFSGGVLVPSAAERRFDEMLVRSAEIPFAKQPIIERSTQLIVGYAGVDTFVFEGNEWLECGWRLVPEARGRGFATEAATAVLGIAGRTFEGEILAMIDPRNEASQNVARKVGFTFWKEAMIDGYLDRLYRLHLPMGAVDQS
ncbi:MAG: GNAT family N-acetyltransferase [Acidimicrobiales bacterium]